MLREFIDFIAVDLMWNTLRFFTQQLFYVGPVTSTPIAEDDDEDIEDEDDDEDEDEDEDDSGAF